jgi:hypothetical protein
MIDIYSWNLIVDLGLLCLQAKKNYLSINIWLYHITHKEEKLLEKPKIYIKSIYIYFLHSHTTQKKKTKHSNKRKSSHRPTKTQKTLNCRPHPWSLSCPPLNDTRKNQLIPTTPSSTRDSSWRIMVLAINHFYLFYNEPLSFNLKGYFPNRELFVLPLERHLYYLHV